MPKSKIHVFRLTVALFIHLDFLGVSCRDVEHRAVCLLSNVMSMNLLSMNRCILVKCYLIFNTNGWWMSIFIILLFFFFSQKLQYPEVGGHAAKGNSFSRRLCRLSMCHSLVEMQYFTNHVVRVKIKVQQPTSPFLWLIGIACESAISTRKDCSAHQLSTDYKGAVL